MSEKTTWLAVCPSCFEMESLPLETPTWTCPQCVVEIVQVEQRTEEDAIMAAAKAAYAEAWETCKHLDRFETWATLYYRRYSRVSPGKSEAFGRDTNSRQNRLICDAWHKSGLAKLDAVMALSAAWERIDALTNELEDAKDDLAEATGSALTFGPPC